MSAYIWNNIYNQMELEKIRWHLVWKEADMAISQQLCPGQACRRPSTKHTCTGGVSLV